MPKNLAGLKLRCRRDHWGWAGWEIRDMGGYFFVTVPCDRGDHYLWHVENSPQKVVSSTNPMVYYTREQAEAAVAAWERQDAGKNGGE